MRHLSYVLVAVAFLSGATVFAQEAGTGAGRIEVAAFPGGGILFTETTKSAEPNFTNYTLGGSFTLNANRWVGFEGEAGGSLGLKQTLTFNGTELVKQKTPNMLNYMGNVLFNPIGNDRALVPYGTAGLGGLTMFNGKSPDTGNLGVTKNDTYLTGNIGGGLKWFATRHVGLRADYRLLMVKNKDTAPAFFGTDNRFGHRVYGGLLLTY